MTSSINNSSAGLAEHSALVEYDQSILFYNNELINDEQQAFNIDLNEFDFENIDLTESIDIDLNESIKNDETSLLNSFDLNDPKLFSFINEIDLISSPQSDSAYDSFSSSCSPSSETDNTNNSCSEEQQIKMVKSNKGVEKRESNKAAASRYRSKKSKERNDLFQQTEIYEKKNIELKEKIQDVEAEINSIRSLLIQALLIKENVLYNSSVIKI